MLWNILEDVFGWTSANGCFCIEGVVETWFFRILENFGGNCQRSSLFCYENSGCSFTENRNFVDFSLGIFRNFQNSWFEKHQSVVPMFKKEVIARPKNTISLWITWCKVLFFSLVQDVVAKRPLPVFPL